MWSNSRWLPISYRFAMLLIPIVEAIVGGPVTSWPRIDLEFFFFIPTTPPITATTIASFLYGNGVPCSLALQFVKLCREDTNLALLNDIYNLYTAWANSSDSDLSIFWHLRRNTHMLLNGSYRPHTVIERPFAGPLPAHAFGFDEKPESQLMRQRLRYLRNNAHIF